MWRGVVEPIHDRVACSYLPSPAATIVSRKARARAISGCVETAILEQILELARLARIEIRPKAVDRDRQRRNAVGAKPRRSQEAILDLDQRRAPALELLDRVGRRFRSPDRDRAVGLWPSRGRSRCCRRRPTAAASTLSCFQNAKPTPPPIARLESISERQKPKARSARQVSGIAGERICEDGGIRKKGACCFKRPMPPYDKPRPCHRCIGPK
jgi:hypothetical protein